MPKGRALAVDRSLPDDRDVFSIAREDQVSAVGIAFLRRTGMIFVVIHIGAAVQYCASLKI
jgi:hypothetical protein